MGGGLHAGALGAPAANGSGRRAAHLSPAQVEIQPFEGVSLEDGGVADQQLHRRVAQPGAQHVDAPIIRYVDACGLASGRQPCGPGAELHGVLPCLAAALGAGRRPPSITVTPSASSSSLLRLQTATTCMPRAFRAVARPSPIPRLAPVTTATPSPPRA